ncbi:MAG: FAD-dependent monooxygenase [Burkholderiales bacterium]|nr:FAD-dependent monooxygenase [Burkholderiales bacterium]
MSMPLLRIEGHGPVALALRLFLARQGFAAGQVAIDEPIAELPDWLAARSLAMSLGSWQLLSRIAALPPAAVIETVEVSMSGHSGRTRMQARDLRQSALGYVLRYGDLHRALVTALKAAGLAAPTVAEHETAATPLTLVADGDTGPDARTHDFDQTALLAEIAIDGAGHGVAYERFTAEGPLAMLPLPEPARYALVWCARPAQAERRAGLEPEHFNAELQQAFGDALGQLRLDSARHLSPLQRRVRAAGHDPQRIALGNAAQALHPVAGQGLNLGLRDAFVLAQRLGDARAAQRPLLETAAEFERARRGDRGATVTLTDTLARLFTAEPLRALESLALGALDLLPPLRNRLAMNLMFGRRG